MAIQRDRVCCLNELIRWIESGLRRDQKGIAVWRLNQIRGSGVQRVCVVCWWWHQGCLRVRAR